MLKKIKDLTTDEKQDICEPRITCEGCPLNILRVNREGHICLGSLLNFIDDDDMQNVLEKIENEVEI